jgi:hypothetical protein
MPTVVPTPSIGHQATESLEVVSRRTSRDLQVTLIFDPMAPTAATEIVVADAAQLSDEEYLGLLRVAAARLVLYCDDYAAASRQDNSEREEVYWS